MRARSASRPASRLREIAGSSESSIARDAADLVLAVVGDRAREVCRPRSAARRRRWRAGAGAQRRGQDPGQRDRGGEPGREAERRQRAHRGELASTSVSGSARRTNASSGMPGWRTGMATYSMSVPTRGAVALRRAEALLRAPRRSRAASPWFSIARQLLGGQIGVAEHPAVGGDEGDARAEDPAERVGLGVELRLGRRRRGAPAARRRCRASHDRARARSAARGCAARDHETSSRRHQQRQRRRRERRQEDLGAKRRRHAGRLSACQSGSADRHVRPGW